MKYALLILLPLVVAYGGLISRDSLPLEEQLRLERIRADYYEKKVQDLESKYEPLVSEKGDIQRVFLHALKVRLAEEEFDLKRIEEESGLTAEEQNRMLKIKRLAIEDLQERVKKQAAVVQSYAKEN